jgi:hypothetical protein
VNDAADENIDARWAFSVVSRRNVNMSRGQLKRPLISALRAGRSAHVVSAEIIRQWCIHTEAVAIRAVLVGNTLETAIDTVDLFRLLDGAGLTGERPENVLLVEDSAGIQLGRKNRQVNIYHLSFDQVRIHLDKTLANHLTDSIATSRRRGSNSIKSLDGVDRVIVRNSRGIQIGNNGLQRNVYNHVFNGSEISLAQFCPGGQFSRIVGKLLERRTEAAKRDIEASLRRGLNVDPAALIAALPEGHNQSTYMLHRRVVGETCSTHGQGSIQKVHATTTRVRIRTGYVHKLEKEAERRFRVPRNRDTTTPADSSHVEVRIRRFPRNTEGSILSGHVGPTAVNRDDGISPPGRAF